MLRSRSLLFVTLALILVGLGGWILSGGGSRDTGIATGPDAAAENPAATSLHSEGGPDAAAALNVSDAQRSEVAAGAAGTAGVGITGQVVDASGKPVAAAKVVCQARPDFDFDPDTFDPDDLDLDSIRDRFRGVRSESTETLTDAQGRFRVGAPGSSANIQLRVEARAFLVLNRSVPRPTDRDVDLGALTVQTGAIVSGRVLDRGGRPVAEARVSRRGERARGGDFEGIEFLAGDIADRFGGGDGVTTDAEGRFELLHAAPGNFSLVARHEEFPTARRDGLSVLPGGTLADVIVTVEPGTTIAGKLLDIPKGTDRLRVLASVPRGNGDGNANNVLAFLGDTGEMLGNFGGSERSADVGKDGSFRLRGLATGQTYKVWAVQRGRGFTGNATCSQRHDVVSGAQDVELRYEAGVTVTFTALDAATGAPIEKLWVSDRLVGASREGFDFMSFAPSFARARTYPEGKVTIANLRPKEKQTLTLAVEALGFAKQERKGIEMPLVGQLDLGAIRFEPTPIVTVQVTSNVDGTPVAGATVQLRERRQGNGNNPLDFAMQIQMPGMTTPQSGKTDAEGKVMLNGKKGGTVAVAVTGKEWAPYESADLTVSERGATHDVRMLRGGTVEVTVLDADGKPAPETNVDHKGPGDVSDSRRTDQDGIARFEHLTPGEHRFKLGGRGNAIEMAQGMSFQMRMDGARASATDDWQKVAVADETKSTVQLAKSAVASLSGFVRENGLPLAGAQVSFVKGTGGGEEGAEAQIGQAIEATLGDLGGGGRNRGTTRNRTDESGSYALSNLPVGEHRLRITHKERAMPTTVRISLRAGSNAFDVGLATTILRGTVRDHAGKPVAGASVSVAAGNAAADAVGVAMDVFGSMPEMAQFGGRRGGGVTTDDQGRYELRGVQDGVPITVRAQAKGCAPATSKPVTPAAGTTTDDVDVQLLAAGSVRVRYTTQAPFASVMATCTSAEGVPPVTRMLRRGEVTLDGLQPGTWKLTLMLPGGTAPDPRTVEVVPGQVVDVAY